MSMYNKVRCKQYRHLIIISNLPCKIYNLLDCIQYMVFGKGYN